MTSERAGGGGGGGEAAGAAASAGRAARSRRPWSAKPARATADPDPELTRLRELAIAIDLRCRKTGTPAQVARVEIPVEARGGNPGAPTSRIEYGCPACGVQGTGTRLHFGQDPPGRAEEIEAEEERLAAAEAAEDGAGGAGAQDGSGATRGEIRAPGTRGRGSAWW